MGNTASDSNRGGSNSGANVADPKPSINPEQADILIEHLKQFMNSVLDDFKEKLVKHQVGDQKAGEAADELLTAIESESDELHTGVELGCSDELRTVIELRSDELSTAIEKDSNEELLTAVESGAIGQLRAALRTAVELGSGELRTAVELSAIGQLLSAIELGSSDQLLTAIQLGSEDQLRTAVELGSGELRTAVELGAIGQLLSAIESGSEDQLFTAVELGAVDQLLTAIELGSIDQLLTAIESGSSNQLLTAIEFGSRVSLLNFCRETLKEVLADEDSRRIFYFLCANLGFCAVEFCYGFWTNSLGLISDGFHMLFDCSALVMGLVASVMARWTSSRYYSYGYGRVEVLSGFINALFLIVIALFIFLEALERLYDPPDVQTDKLMFVAVSGLLVNLFGMYAFSHTHSHGGGGDHGHSHGGGDHGHSHGVVAMPTCRECSCTTLLIQLFGWQWVDPLCSLILSMLILGSVYPLLKSSASVLLQSIPGEVDSAHALDEICHLEGVLDQTQFHVWQLKSGVNVASIHVRTTDQANDQLMRQRVHQILRKWGATQICVQVEKEAFGRNGSYNSSGLTMTSSSSSLKGAHACLDMAGSRS
uniref:Proton-coupled zinc antiporter SLC30A5 n=1 Tax=Ditylenchus dipsaci TaxID=166011 RepID=A0A915EF86_9BILA